VPSFAFMIAGLDQPVLRKFCRSADRGLARWRASAAGLDIAKTVKELASSPQKRDLRFYDETCRALRFIYFPDTGVLGLLKDVVADKPIPEERLQKVLTDFNDYEWKIRDILESIGFNRLEKELGLSLATIKVLQKIRDGKAGLRQDVQEEINFYGQRNFKPNKDRITKLIKGIEKLNAEIETAEEIINRRAKV
jgi:hypothetical protein